MAERPLTMFVGRLRGLLAKPGDSADLELLGRFIANRDEGAFSELVQRHGAMVLGVCRRVLNDAHAAEDAFQATFLVLARKAESLSRNPVLASWLYGVALRTALKARTTAVRRHHHESQAEPLFQADATTEVMWRELRPILDEELDRLPAKYRVPVVLCCLEGQTHDAAARQLGWPKGTVAGRLARAREVLRSRLTRRGITLTAAGLATVLSSQAASAALPASLLSTTVQAATAGTVPATIAGLAKGVMHSMFLLKLRLAMAMILAVGAIGSLTSVWAYQALTSGSTTIKQTAEHANKPGNDKPPTDQQRIQGTWVTTAGERYGIQFSEDQLDREPEFVFMADKLVMKRTNNELEMKFELLPAEQPKVIAMTFQDGPAKGKSVRGIYAFEAERLKLCMDMVNGDDAKTFAGGRGTQFTLLILERKEKLERDDADEKLREAKARKLTEKSLHDIAIAMHNRHNDFNRLPPAALCDANGKPLLSWRVELLPYLAHDYLYKQFKLDEAWDSDHNKKLIPTMPKVFAPRMGKPKDPFTTYYRVFHGNGAAFEGIKGLTLAADFRGGISNTILVVEAGEAVPWTKPDELEYDPVKPLPKLGGQFKDGFYVVMADGSKHFIKNQFDEKPFRAIISRSNGHSVKVEDFKK